MPELPEVERARALIEARALGRRIAAVDDSDTYVCRPHAPGEIAGALTGARLIAAHRRGKTMWCETDRGPVLGTTWDRFALEFEDGGRLVLRDKRRLGRAVLDPVIERLGPDAAEVSVPEFRERVGRGTAPLKVRIMDQAVIAGVGNLLADEALWQARLAPLRPAGELDDAELDALRRAIRAAARSALRKGGVHTGRVIPARRRDGVCPRCGSPMARATVGGRTTYWCPAEQV